MSTSGVLKPGPHQQQRRSNIVECYKVECCFDNVERCFDIVAKKTATLSKQQATVTSCFDNIVAGVDRALWMVSRI